MRSRILTVLLSATAVTAITTAITMVAVPVGAGSASTRHATKVGIGCHHAATPGVATQTLAVDGAEREYLLSVPASYDPTRPAPLILDFHGLGSDQYQQALYSGLNPKAGAEGYIVITPAGTGVIRHWSWPPLPGGVADVDFVKQMLATTSRTLCIDAKRVYATGISDGAIFSTKLACALPGRLAAIAPVAGVNGSKVCGAGTPRTSVLAFHGTADPIVPYEGGRYFAGAKAADVPEPAGGTSALGELFGGLRAQPVDTAVANWAAFDGCREPPATTWVAADVQHVTYPHCPANGTVELYRVVGGGHTWPGAIPVNNFRLGPTTGSIDATDVMLRFFGAHPRTG
jgi:polyhydroxybutyrate depolymerase